jgi:hypothetical protein
MTDPSNVTRALADLLASIHDDSSDDEGSFMDPLSNTDNQSATGTSLYQFQRDENPPTNARRSARNDLFVDTQIVSGREGNDHDIIDLQSDDVESFAMVSGKSGITTVGSYINDSSSKMSSSKYDIFAFPIEEYKYAQVCRNKVGLGETLRICMNCTTMQRGGAFKIDIPAGSIVVAKSNDTAFVQPSIHHSNVASELISKWQANKKTLDDWAELFTITNSVNDVDVLTAESVTAAETFVKFAL